MNYANLSPEEKRQLNELLSRTTIRSNGTIDGEQNATLAALMAPQGIDPLPAQEPQMPRNFIQVGGTGKVIDLDYAAPGGARPGGISPVTGAPMQHDVWADGPQVMSRNALPSGETEVIRRVPVMDGFGRQSSKIIREIETPDYLNPAKLKELEFRKKFNELTAKPESTYDKELAKGLAEAEVRSRLAKLPGTVENERLVKQQQAQQKDLKRWEGALDQITKMNKFITKAQSQVTPMSAGIVGQVTDFLGSTSARDLKGTLDSIKANIGFDRLQKMREESPTGGALGQVAVQELNFLQAVEGSLDQFQSPDQLRAALAEIQASYGRLVEDLQANPPDWARNSQQQASSRQGGSGAPVPVRSEAEASKLPKGTLVIINGRRAIVE